MTVELETGTSARTGGRAAATPRQPEAAEHQGDGHVPPPAPTGPTAAARTSATLE